MQNNIFLIISKHENEQVESIGYKTRMINSQLYFKAQYKKIPKFPNKNDKFPNFHFKYYQRHHYAHYKKNAAHHTKDNI